MMLRPSDISLKAAFPTYRRPGLSAARSPPEANLRRAILLRFGSLGLPLEGAHERHQILLLLRGQFVAEHQVEELNRVIQRQ
jgi:hypothetical protein